MSLYPPLLWEAKTERFPHSYFLMFLVNVGISCLPCHHALKKI